MSNDLIIQHLLREEGERLEPYQDHLGFWTIGVGHLIDSRKRGYLPEYIRAFPITEAQSRVMLRDDVREKRKNLEIALPWLPTLSPTRQCVLLSMAFQMGIAGLLKFHTTLARIRSGDYYGASTSMLSSLWANQTPERAARLSTAMHTGDPADLQC